MATKKKKKAVKATAAQVKQVAALSKVVADLEKQVQARAGTSSSSKTPAVPAKVEAPKAKDAMSVRTKATDEERAQLQAILNDKSLTDDMRAVIRSVYDATVQGDAAKASRMVSAIAEASKFSEPYFKAQAQLVVDSLKRGLEQKEGDFAFAEQQKRGALEQLRASTQAGKEQLSFQNAQELKQLETKYEQDLSETQDSLAATGFTSSSKRARVEGILSEQNVGLVESSKRQLQYQTGNLDRELAAGETDTQREIDYLREQNKTGKLDLLRQAEEKVGSRALVDLGYQGLVGNVGGQLERDKIKDALSFAGSSGFVF